LVSVARWGLVVLHDRLAQQLDLQPVLAVQLEDKQS
jgi:hypothetical protein